MVENSEKCEMKMPYVAALPDDIVINKILARLPINSIRRFRSICKLWYFATHKPDFITSHHKQAQARPDGGCLVISAKREYDVYSVELSIFSVAYDGGTARSLLSIIRPKHYRVSVSTHGLLLLYPVANHGRLSVDVFNPSTRKLRSLPPLPNYIYQKTRELDISGGCGGFELNYSLGFDPSTGQYKVLAILSLRNTNGSDQLEVYLLILGTQARWMKVDIDFQFSGKVDYERPCFANGTIHWRMQCSNHPHILAFDVGETRFRLIPVPYELFDSNFIERESKCYELIEAAIGDRVAIRKKGIILVLEDYNKGEWIPVKPDIRTDCLISSYNIGTGNRFVITTGEQIVARELWFICCDQNGESHSISTVKGLPDYIAKHQVPFKVSNHVETLFSIDRP